jgi:FixJ family two-component response regulator
MDGHSLARRICAKIPSVGLLFISGHPGRGNDPEDEGRFLAKPFTEAELAQAVTRALSQARRAESQAH